MSPINISTFHKNIQKGDHSCPQAFKAQGGSGALGGVKALARGLKLLYLFQYKGS